MAKNYYELKKLKDDYESGVIDKSDAITRFFEIYQKSRYSGAERRCAKKFARLLDIDEIRLAIEID